MGTAGSQTQRHRHVTQTDSVWCAICGPPVKSEEMPSIRRTSHGSCARISASPQRFYPIRVRGSSPRDDAAGVTLAALSKGIANPRRPRAAAAEQ